MTYRILVGDVLERLADLDDASIQTVITSPPYWGLRDYGTAEWDGGNAGCDHLQPVSFKSSTLGASTGGRSVETHQRSIEAQATPYPETCPKCGARRIDSQLGLEPTPEAYVDRMVEVFRHIRRVLRDDGTVWLNLGDSYANGGTERPGSADGPEVRPHDRVNRRPAPNKPAAPGLKPKDLVGIPWRVAFALQADGWYLRSDIIWAKPNPMPESVTDRPTKSHEYLFLLTKSARYYFDADAVREPLTPFNAEHLARYRERYKVPHLPPGGSVANNNRAYAGGDPAGRNIRTVWNIATEPFPGAHFATFPKKLVEPCVKAGTSEKGCCAECGTPWARIVAREVAFTSGSGAAGNPPNGKNGTEYVQAQSGDYDVRMGPSVQTKTTGWRPSCRCCHVAHSALGAEAADCDGHRPVPCTVLDPFCGSGTTGLVALRHGRSFVGIELNPTYAEMARNRIHNDGPLFNVEAV